MKINLPLKPFSINNAWRGGPRYKSTAYLKWLTEGSWLLKGNPRFENEVEVQINAYMKNYKGRDVDNPIKPTLDLLVAANVLFDDKLVKKVSCEKFKDVDERLEITIEEWTEPK